MARTKHHRRKMSASQVRKAKNRRKAIKKYWNSPKRDKEYMLKLDVKQLFKERFGL